MTDAGLGAGAAVRLIDGELGLRFLFVARNEGAVEVPPQLAGRVVRDVQQFERPFLAWAFSRDVKPAMVPRRETGETTERAKRLMRKSP